MGYEPGESPFHVKGGIYAGTVSYFSSQVEGGLNALYSQIDDPKLLAFIQQKFLASSWYDVLPVAPLIRAEAKAMQLTLPNYLRQRSAYQARQDIGGVYRFLLKLVSPEMVAMRLPRLTTQIFDFGSHEAKKIADKHVQMTLSGYPRVLWEWYSTAFAVYSDTALTHAGAKKVTNLVRAPESLGVDRGVEMIGFTVDCHWE